MLKAGQTPKYEDVIHVPGYSIDAYLRSADHVSTFRGTRKSDGVGVIVKVSEPQAPAYIIARMDREYALTQKLGSTGVAVASAFEAASEGYALVFIDEGGTPLSQHLAGRPLNLDHFFVIAIQLAEVLGHIHAQNIVHKDVKPANCLIHPETFTLQLTGFGMAAPLARERASNVAPVELEGSLDYIAPEQTGRMNRSVDGRSDFYALGISLYQMLTARLPFECTSPAELVHQHIARLAATPHSLDPALPESLSNLVMKLIAKEPEDRYQSAFGLLHDLRNLQQLNAVGTAQDSYLIGQRDIPGRLLLPERLYGRAELLQALVGAVEATARGRAQLLTVVGQSGIGKSALVREVMRPVADRRGFFISGKYDQLNRNMPYSAIVQAFEKLVPKLLTESQLEADQIRARLLQSLGGNAQVILDIMPGFEQLLGKQPEVVELGPSESQYRFNLMFRRFLRALATDEQPLVIFLDDLQWADGASLTLIKVLMSDPDLTNLLLIGAYRDKEVDAGHPLLMLFSELAAAGTPQQNMQLPKLDKRSVAELVADSLHIPLEQSESLSALVFAKTQGNPFFVRQFLNTLSEEGLLEFSSSSMRWHWDVTRIENQQITDNVVDLVAARIYRLEPASRNLVRLGACIGNLFDLETLATVSKMSAVEAAAELSGALQQEIIAPIGEAYKYAGTGINTNSGTDLIRYRFPHDRLQQAAYSTIPQEQRPALHRRIGQLILAKSSQEEIEERIFEIVNHLNMAPDDDADDASRLQLARLNLQAGYKAKSSTAFDAALRYLRSGTTILGRQGWVKQPELAFELNLQCLEATYLAGNFEEAEALARKLLGHAETTLDEIRVRELLILIHTSRLQYRKAILAAVQALSLLGQHVPDSPNQAQLALELVRTRVALSGKSPKDLAQLPEMEDPHMLAALRVLLSASAPAYFDDPNLMPYLALRMVRLSAKYGNAGHSAYGYVLYAAVLCGVLKNMPAGLEYGKLATEIVEKFNAQDIKGKVLQVFGSFVLHWNQRMTDTLPSYLDGASACLDAGDLEFHGYNRYTHLSYSFMSGMPLDQVWELINHHYAAVLDHKHEKTQLVMRMMRKAVRKLRGPAADPLTEDEEAFDEDAMVALWTDRDRQALAYYHKYRLVTQYMERDFQACLDSAAVITELHHTVVGMYFSAYYIFFEGLALTGVIPTLAGLPKIRAVRRTRAIQASLRKWSEHAPENYQHKYLLISAELYRVTNKPGQAESAYEQAALLAHRHGSLHDEAIAYELMAEFHLQRNRKVIARTYLGEACEAYRRWGGDGWIAHLEGRHAELLGTGRREAVPHPELQRTRTGEAHDFIDIASITQAARAISEKIILDDVLTAVLHAALVNAGAGRGLLLLLQGDELLLKAEATSDSDDVILHSAPASDSEKVPASIINYVVRSQSSIVLDDAATDPNFSNDRYFKKSSARSVLCTPLIDKGMLIGFLYLENALVHGAFTPARIQTLEVLAAQAAISLENARLYREVSDHAESLELKVAERTAELEDAYSLLQDVFGKYVPRRVAEQLVTGGGSLHPIQTTATILYSDIEGFTGIAESMAPERVVDMLNEYFPAVIEPIERNGGVVNQFQGDAMLVTFNVPLADECHADKAVQTAIEIQQAIAGRKFAGVTLRTRIGINTGEVLAGNVGSGNRINYTVHGDAVNLAARIEQLNKEYQTLVLVSGTTVELLQQDYALDTVGQVTVRGKTSPVKLLQLRGSWD